VVPPPNIIPAQHSYCPRTLWWAKISASNQPTGFYTHLFSDVLFFDKQPDNSATVQKLHGGLRMQPQTNQKVITPTGKQVA